MEEEGPLVPTAAWLFLVTPIWQESLVLFAVAAVHMYRSFVNNCAECSCFQCTGSVRGLIKTVSRSPIRHLTRGGGCLHWFALGATIAANHASDLLSDLL